MKYNAVMYDVRVKGDKLDGYLPTYARKQNNPNRKAKINVPLATKSDLLPIHTWTSTYFFRFMAYSNLFHSLKWQMQYTLTTPSWKISHKKSYIGPKLNPDDKSCFRCDS
jgi:hypothetical protein